MVERERLAAFVAWYRDQHRSQFAYQPRHRVYEESLLWPHGAPSVEELAAELLSTEEFKLLELGGFLSTPEGHVFRAAVELVIPGYYKADIDLLVAGLELASRMQQKIGRQRAGLLALAVVCVALLGLGRGE